MPNTEENVTIEIPDFIWESSKPIDKTYFRTSDISPWVDEDDNTICIDNWRGAYRSWGAPYCQSTWQAFGTKDNFVIITVQFGNKHSFGTQKYYFVKGNDDRYKKHTKNAYAVKNYLEVIPEAEFN
jgi:hypothetical protein